jgi:hypothetical protein
MRQRCALAAGILPAVEPGILPGAGVWRFHRLVDRPFQMGLDRPPKAETANPEGIVSLSPGLRAARYPGWLIRMASTLKGLHRLFLSRRLLPHRTACHGRLYNPFRVNGPSAHTQGSARRATLGSVIQSLRGCLRPRVLCSWQNAQTPDPGILPRGRGSRIAVPVEYRRVIPGGKMPACTAGRTPAATWSR